MRVPSAVALVVIVVSPVGLSARDQAADPTGWLGTRVVLQFGSVLRVGDQVVDNQKLQNRIRGGQRNTHRIYRVGRINGPWLWLQAEQEGVAGWVPAAEVIRYEQALEYFTNQIRANPSMEAAYTSRGHIWVGKKEFDLALADYTEALRLDPGSEVGWNNRGKAWHAKKEYDKAIADFNEAIRIDPNNAAFQSRHSAARHQAERCNRRYEARP